MKKYFTKKLLVASILAAASLSAYAVPPHSPYVAQGSTSMLWSITFYDDTSNVHSQWATQNICFIPTGVQGSNAVGIWYSTTYQRWLGRWRQEGDQIFMIGNFWTDRGNDAMQWEITVANKEGFGNWEEWVDDSAFGGWLAKGNTKFVNLGKCPWTPWSTSTGIAISVDDAQKMVIEQAGMAPLRVRQDGVVPSPTDRLQLPLTRPIAVVPTEPYPLQQ